LFRNANKEHQKTLVSAMTDAEVKTVVYSLSGSIKQFFNFEDDEVLYLPQTTFLVLDKKYDATTNKNMLYLRQIEIGMTPKVWVDVTTSRKLRLYRYKVGVALIVRDEIMNVYKVIYIVTLSQ